MNTTHCADDRRAALCRMMETYGDAVLRTCYLLCGELRIARPAAQRVFLRAAVCPEAWTGLSAGCALPGLLRICVRECPCRLFLLRPPQAAGPVSALLRLPPGERRAAVLCLYHGLSPADAARVLHTGERTVVRRLARARRRLADQNKRGRLPDSLL